MVSVINIFYKNGYAHSAICNKFLCIKFNSHFGTTGNVFCFSLNTNIWKSILSATNDILNSNRIPISYVTHLLTVSMITILSQNTGNNL